ncbi:rRNA-binding ribosome biosynthesis protein NOP15 [Lachancea thermotolerans CBS 6340]|uniref:KLTH0D09262p n=1 Tax=Lachancea thermotolerans (strain ATCC 56472 / CBS 6340 / NRRL Y-8284) TaxID=559295 RepID=C5DGY4_LACTC|nr:KLTH0D09262p [Lachancea thermotolerans CBS 6340]CAR22676.1 KLTH0D09262p [Lachancea thermotolerans CBS 6340]
MAKSTTKQATPILEAEPVREEQLELGNSSSNESEIEGLSEDDEAGSGEEQGSSGSRASSGVHTVKKLDAKKRESQQEGGKGSKKGRSKAEELSGIIYVSRLPKGFHERELAKYFSQFGDLREVRLARNKKTGNSRHYGFVEFVNKEDALVAQETMHNYLLMNHLLQVVALPKGKKIEKLFHYKKRAFSETSVTKSSEELKQRAIDKHAQRAARLQDKGIEFKW